MRKLAIYTAALVFTAGFVFPQDDSPGAPGAVQVDVQHYEISAEIIPENGFLRGEAKIRFSVLQDVLTIPFDLNSRLSIIEIVDLEGTSYSTSFDGVESQRLGVRGENPFRAGADTTLVFRFEGGLERQEYAFLDTPRTEKAVIHRDGALLLPEGHWFPSYRLQLDAATSDVKISVPLGFSVVAPGVMQPTEISGVTEVFRWKSTAPVTRIPVVVSRFFRQEVEAAPVPTTLFVAEEHDQDLAPLTREINQILEFFAKEYGSFPFEALNIAAAGNVNLSSTGAPGLILLEDGILLAKTLPVVEIARRLAAQWWGYSVRPKEIYDAWLQDGFAELAKQAVNALKYEQKAAIGKGFELGEGSPEYQSIVASKGAWVLYMLGQLIGKEKLNTLLIDWYRQHVGNYATTPEFVRFVQEQSGADYKWFFMQWVESTGVPDIRVDYSILKRRDGTFAVRGQIKQDQELFRMPLEMLIETKGQEERKKITLSGKTTSFNFTTQTLPVWVKLDPDGKILRDSEQMQVQVQIALGEEYQAKGEYVEAIRAFEKARELDPRSSLAAYRMGEVMFLQHSFTNAANAFRDALNGDLKPDWVETWTHIYMGKIYDILNQRERATAEYQKAINTKNDYNGAQAEAQKYLKEPFTKPQSIIG